jgi:hypothetical protein
MNLECGLDYAELGDYPVGTMIEKFGSLKEKKFNPLAPEFSFKF